jgi:hypothetical protein
MTASYQVNGILETVGPTLEFINDTNRDGLVMTDVRVAPLSTGGISRELSLPQMTLRRHEIIFVAFELPESREGLHLMQRREYIIMYTPVAVVRAGVHLPAETLTNDFLTSTTGDLLPVSDAQIHLFTTPSLPFSTQADLLMIGRGGIQFFHDA